MLDMPRIYLFSKTEINAMLTILDKEYKKVYYMGTKKSTRLMQAFSKMAVLAIGGWLEDGIKQITKLSTSKLKEIKNQEKIENMVSRIYGFKYEDHFTRGILWSFGAHGFEYIETEVGSADIARLSSTLNNLKTWRDVAAHSHSRIIPCNPNQIITEMNNIFPILKKIEASAKKYKNIHF